MEGLAGARRQRAHVAGDRRGGDAGRGAVHHAVGGGHGLAAGQARGQLGDLRRAHAGAARRQPARGGGEAHGRAGVGAGRGGLVRAGLPVRLHPPHPGPLVASQVPPSGRRSGGGVAAS